MFRFIKRCLFTLLVLLVIPLLYVGFKILSYSHPDNTEHLEAKQEYLASLSRESISHQSPPNILLILLDDLGYGDLGVTGSRAIATPNLDTLAEQGLRLSNFYSPAPVCTPARAGILTGRLPLRAGMPEVVFPTGHPISYALKIGDVPSRIPAEEITLADILSAVGYDTGMVGKWHLGDRSPSLPNDMGFASYFGALYSNDMTPFALYRNDQVEVEAPADQTRLNEWYVKEAQAFVSTPRQQPFFLYYAHNFPHIPLYSSAGQAGQSDAGLYGDVVEDVDRGIGEILQTLTDTGQLENTLVLMTSDNGPWYQGSRGQFRGRKADTFEGGMKVPLIVHWPAGLAGGKVLEGMSMGTDLLPTIADWLGLPLPQDRIIDGKSIRSMLAGEQQSPHQALYYFAGEKLMAVRDAGFKYHKPRPIAYVTAGSRFSFGPAKGPWLFDNALDVDESYDVSMRHPERLAALARLAAEKEQEMQTNMRGWR
jgi:arylsulfatase A-like enzyme